MLRAARGPRWPSGIRRSRMDSRAARRALYYATWLTKLPLKNPSRDREVSAFADDAKFRVSKPLSGEARSVYRRATSQG